MLPTALFLMMFASINLILLASYYYLRVNTTDFGDVHKNLHMYMLFFAALAYLLNLIHVVYISLKGKNVNFNIQVAAFTYYTLQLLFIPFVRKKWGNLTRLLLFLCCLPIYYLHVAAKENFIKIISKIVLFHVFFNDFVLYGILHDPPRYLQDLISKIQ